MSNSIIFKNLLRGVSSHSEKFKTHLFLDEKVEGLFLLIFGSFFLFHGKKVSPKVLRYILVLEKITL